MRDMDERLVRLLQAWTAMRGDGPVPDYSALRPDRLSFMLPDLCLIDVRPDGGHRFRLAGTGIVDRLRRDPTGHDLDIVGPAAAAALAGLFGSVRRQARPVAASGRLMLGGGDRVFQALCLPFADTTDAVTVLLLGFAFRPWAQVTQVPLLGTLDSWTIDPGPAPAQRASARGRAAC